MLDPFLWCVSSRLALLPCFPKSSSVSRVLYCNLCVGIGLLRLLLLLLLLASPVPLQRDLRWWPRRCESFEKYSISVLSHHTVSAVSWYCGVGHDCKWLRLPELQSLILRFRSSYPIFSILVVFPTSFIWFLHTQLFGTNVRLSVIHKTPAEVDFESSRSPAKSESGNKPNRQCKAMLPTWQCCR